MKRLLAGAASPAVAAAVLAGTGVAATQSVGLNGTAPNGGCGSVQAVNLIAASTIVVHVSAGAAENGPPQTGNVYVQFLDGSGRVLASGPSDYRASGPGTYGVRVCVPANSENPSSVPYSGEISLTKAAGVAGASATKATTALGRVGVRTSHGLVYFSVRAARDHTTLRVDDSTRNLHLGLVTGLRAHLGVNRVALTGRSTSFVLTQSNTGAQHVVFHWRRYAASGTVVSGRVAFA